MYRLKTLLKLGVFAGAMLILACGDAPTAPDSQAPPEEAAQQAAYTLPFEFLVPPGDVADDPLMIESVGLLSDTRLQDRLLASLGLLAVDEELVPYVTSDLLETVSSWRVSAGDPADDEIYLTVIELIVGSLDQGEIKR